MKGASVWVTATLFLAGVVAKGRHIYSKAGDTLSKIAKEKNLQLSKA